MIRLPWVQLIQQKAITVDGTNGTIKAGKDGNAVAINGTDGTIKAGDGTNAVAIDGVNGSVKVADKNCP